MMIPPLPRIALVAATAAAREALRPAAETLAEFGLQTVETSGDEDFSQDACAWIVASPGPEWPARVAARTGAPVIRVPAPEEKISALETLRWPAGEGAASFATVAIGEAGARNAALLAVSILALDNEPLRVRWIAFRAAQTAAVLRQPPPCTPR